MNKFQKMAQQAAQHLEANDRFMAGIAIGHMMSWLPDEPGITQLMIDELVCEINNGEPRKALPILEVFSHGLTPAERDAILEEAARAQDDYEEADHWERAGTPGY